MATVGKAGPKTIQSPDTTTTQLKTPEKVAKQAEVKETPKLKAEVPSQAVPEKTAEGFVAKETGVKTGDSVFALRTGGDGFVSQAQMNQEAGAKLGDARQKMNDVLFELFPKLDAETLLELQKAQQCFDGYVDAQAEFEGNFEARGGSMKPLVFCTAAQQLVEARTQQLQSFNETDYMPGATTAKIPPDANQMEMTLACHEAFDAADEKMTKLLDKIMDDVIDYDPRSAGELEAAQKSWVQFREANATLAANNEARGGSMANMIWAGNAEATTRDRIDQLLVLKKSVDDMGIM